MELFLATQEGDENKALPSVVSPSHFLQTDFWASFKEAHGWKSFRVQGRYNPATYLDTCAGLKTAGFTCSILTRTFSLPLVGRVSLAYIPMGLELPESPEIMVESKLYGKILSDFSYNLRRFLEKNTLCIRFDIPIDLLSLEEREAYRKAIPCRFAPDNIQPPDTVLVDLTATEDEILGRMKSKWRYNIRLAEKKGVEVRRGAAKDIEIFYDLYKTTSRRDGIAIHNKEYYLDLLERGQSVASKDTRVDLYIASYQGEPLAAIITLFAGVEAVYLYGASSNSHRNLMPAYLLQWVAIKDARAAGCKVYDMYGIPPTDDEGHPMHGLYRFKTGFGGKIVHRPGSLDIPLSPLYGFYVLGERGRNFWYKRVKKLLVGR